MNLKFLFEDKHIIVVKKPFGILTQPDNFSNGNDLLSLVKSQCNLKEIYLIHRLDRPVGGIIVFAKNKKSAKILCEYFSTSDIKKFYIAVVYGNTKQSDYLENWLIKNQRLNLSKVVNKNSPYSKVAKLSYEKLSEYTSENTSFSLLKIHLLTGRHHQIRVQLSNSGFPIYGDNKYNNNPKCEKQLGYIALWSNILTINHPISKEELTFECNPDEVFPFNLFI